VAADDWWQTALLAVRFATELALLAVLVIAGAFVSTNLAVRLVLAILAPVLAIVIWGFAIAPRAKRRIPDPWRLAAETMLFLAASAELAFTAGRLAGAIFVVVTVGVAAATRVVSSRVVTRGQG